jgi:rSAM-partnered protein
MTDERDRSPAGDGAASRPSAGDAWTVVETPRADDEPEWELFLRESATEPLRHAGSITAPGAEVAHERATGLFPDATTLWCCPSEAVARFTERDLGAAYRRSDEEAADGAGDDTGGERE